MVRTVGPGPRPGFQTPAYREAVGLLNAYSIEAFQNDPRLLANYLTYFRDRFVYVRTVGARQPGHPHLAYDGTRPAPGTPASAPSTSAGSTPTSVTRASTPAA